ncbi:hypothetical protein JIG36_27035 [Actinoplanes sp. LDG1-06]|uniref:MmpS family membrane protein n=1 Tax=Paractinoplanes ovalisporus TaxID=2810368 RepID=A0ABS2AHA1_9ACTN|nr:MmpS family transport accessory protein [Actinoplanes ovalisporus]MBM2619212.1 hypothetical protein [Actinoplanes ovalisporus]
MSNQPENRQPDGTSEPTTPIGGHGAAPVSGQPWSTPSGDSMSQRPYPPSYTPGYASLPQPPNPDYPPTSEFPATPTDQIPGAYAPPPGYGPPSYPPPGYQQPGYPPPPGYGQPAYPQGPPPPPPRKSKLPIVAALVAITLLLCGGLATAGVMLVRNVTDKAKEALPELPTAAPEIPDLPTDLPSIPAAPGVTGRKISVTYEVSGEGQASQILYVEKLGDAPKRLQDVSLPWKFTTEMETPALVSVVAMRVGTSEGTIKCRALVDGAEVKQRTSSSSTVATASCTHFAIE